MQSPNLEDLSHVLIEFYEKMSSWEAAVVREQKITLPQVHAVEILGCAGGLRMKELASRMGITTGTLTVMIDRLEDKGLVERQRSKEDRRVILCHLTPAGEVVFNDHHKHHAALTEELAADLSDEEVTALSSMLRKMLERF
ncbi:MAG: MarR family winged helix-turn-helix transcriptional regulator [Desulfovibrio sp.]